jgi:phosphoglycolate phosphatase
VPTRLIVFDLDGTLIDSRRDLADAANALIAELGGAPLNVDAITSMVGEGARMLVQRTLTAAQLAVDPDAVLPRFLDLYDERLLAHTTLYPGTSDALRVLREHATLALLTNKPRHHTLRILAGLAIADWFGEDQVVGGDGPLGRKPDPSGLRHLMAKADASAAATTLVGDSAIDLRTARAAGVRVCLVRYGFGFPLAASELAGHEAIADRPEDLLRLIE